MTLVDVLLPRMLTAGITLAVASWLGQQINVQLVLLADQIARMP